MKITWRGIRNVIHRAVLLKPLLRILGVKRGTVADKAMEAGEVIDKALPPGEAGK
jgi:hypothetical protein